MKRLLFAAAVTVCLFGAVSVSAADLTASDAGIVTFLAAFDESMFENEYDTYFSYRVVDAKGDIYAYGQVTENSGNVSFDFRIKGETGVYTLVLSNRKVGRKTYTIDFTNNLYADFNEVKATWDADEMNVFLIDNGAYCGLDTAAYNLLSDSERNSVISYFMSQSDINSMAALTDVFNKADVTNRFFKTVTSANDIKKYIEESCNSENSIFNTPEARVFANELTEEKKLAVAKTLIGKLQSEAELNAFKFEVLKASVSQMIYYVDMERVIYSEGNIWGFKDSDLNRLYTADKNAVYKGMVSGVQSAADIEACRSLLTRLIDENPAGESSFPNTDGSSYGSSVVGSGNVVFSYQSGMYNPYPENIKTDSSFVFDAIVNIDFKDLGGYEWAEEAINKLVENYVISGITNTEFEAGRTIKREEFVKMITSGLRLTGAEAVVTFGDVKEGDWFYPYVGAAQRANIVSGDTENNFGVGQDITRQDAAVMVSRALSASGAELELGEAVEFTDEDSISGYAKSAVSKLAKAGIINGMADGSFAPQNSITRAEAAQMLYSFLSKAGLLKW